MLGKSLFVSAAQLSDYDLQDDRTAGENIEELLAE